VLEALIQSGALDSLGARRSQLEAVLDAALEYGQKLRADRQAGQSSLFGGGAAGYDADEATEERALPDVPEWDEQTRLNGEKATLGFYVSGHPLERYRDLLQEFATHDTSSVRTIESGSDAAIGGIISELRKRKSRKGDWWASLQLEDTAGQLEVLVFPKCYQAHHQELEPDRAAMIVGRVEIDDERIRLIADKIRPLDRVREGQAEAVQVALDAATLDDALVGQLLRAVESHRGDAVLSFLISREGDYRMVARAETALRVSPSASFLAEIESLLGPDRVRCRSRGMLERADAPTH
jgi:DNA polymerase-3 subunit alpha